MSSFSVDGIISGMNTTDVINQLMSVERQPVTRLQTNQTQYDTIASVWRDIGTRLATFNSSLADLTSPTKLNPLTATSSDTSVVTATAGVGATPGSTVFRVQQLAASHQLASTETFADGKADIGTGTAVVASGLSKVGGTGVSVSSDFAAGSHRIEVHTLNSGEVTVVLDDTVISLGSPPPNAPVTVSTPGGGSVTIDVGASGLHDGTIDLQVVRPAGGTLNDLVAGINGGTAARAQLLNASGAPNGTQMVLTATGSGTAGELTVNLSGFTGLSSTTQIRPAQDAQIILGSLTVTRSSNTVTDLIPGVTLNLVKADATKDITLTVGQDADTIVSRVKSFVNALNGVLQKVQDVSSYNADTKQAGILLGDSTVRSVASRLVSAMQSAVASTGTVRTLSQLGISFQTTGLYALDESKLRSALTSDPDALRRLFATSGATTGSPLISYSAATTDAVPSTGAGYTVNVTQAAEQATVTGAAFTALSTDETVTITLGSAAPVSFTAVAGASPDAVAAGLNALFQRKGVGVQATVTPAGGGAGTISLTTTSYGGDASLTVSSTGDTGLNGTDTGVDVAGTIDGVAATGAGQLLTGASSLTKGLSVQVRATPAEVGSGISAQVTYSPGAATALARAVTALQGAGGTVDSAVNSATSASKALGLRIDDWNDRLTATEQRYRMMFATLETTLGQLKNQGSWLSSQIASLPSYR